jgi:hypothetical protein
MKHVQSIIWIRLAFCLIVSTPLLGQDWWGCISKEMPAQTESFILEFDLQPREDSVLRSHITLTDKVPATWTDNACIIRANPDASYFDVRNGGAYEAQNSAPFEEFLDYHFKMIVYVEAYSYDVFVNAKPDGEVIEVFIDAGFRTDQVTAGLTEINMINVTIPYIDEGTSTENYGADLYNIKLKNMDGEEIWDGGNLVEGGDPSAVETEIAIPLSFELSQNYPNPFNPTTQIAFTLPKQETVSLNVYNLLGKQVAWVVNAQTFSAGTHSLTFDASNLSSGVYIYRLEAGSLALTKKMTLVR